MKEISFKKLSTELLKNKIVIVHITSDRCIPCKNQEKRLKKICNQYKNKDLVCYSINIDENTKSKKDLSSLQLKKMPIAIPALSIYINGEIQNFNDNTLLKGEETQILYGERKNIEHAVTQALKKIH